MRAIAILLAFSFAVASTAAAATELPSTRLKLGAPGEAATLTVPAIDAAKSRAEHGAGGKGVAQQYALGAAVDVSAGDGAKAAGRWQTLADGTRLWRLDVRAPGAVGVDLGFAKMFLPQGAALYVASADGREVRGPFTDADITRHGEFWTPIVAGDGARIELVVPAALERFVTLDLAVVHSAFRLPFETEAFDASGKSLYCHIDTVCADANPYRDPVKATAGYTLNGPSNVGVSCTGTLLNNAAQDGRRFFLTANHCLSSQTTANSVVVYWQFQSPTCRARTPGGPSGNPISISTAIAHTGGTTLRHTYAGTDSTLLELNTAIPAAVDEYFAGWDASGALPAASAIVHHSNGDEKRISFDDNAPVVNAGQVNLDTIRYVAGGSMSVTYDRNTTTEGGASGGGLFTPTGRVIGQLGGGPAGSCSVGITDTYGRLATAWEGGGTDLTRLRRWLDPNNTGVLSLAGRGACTAPTVTLTASAAAAAAGDEIVFTAAVAGTGPYTVAWDVDGDAIVDRTATNVTTTTSLPVAYPTATTTTLTATVTDAAGCTGTAQRAVNVSAPDIVLTPGALTQVCGDGDGAIEPGESWRVGFTANNASRALDRGYAVFATGGATAGAGTLDSFGYRTIDSTQAGCGYQAIPISNGAAPQALIPTSDDFEAEDDGRTAPLALGPGGIDLYGDVANQLVMSTNGYLAADLGDDGGQFQHSCPDTFSSDTVLDALHQDLVVRPGGGLYREYFATCPRTGEAGGGARGCTVFTWRHMTRIVPGTAGSTEGDFSFQAIVYDGTYQIVYQYLEGATTTSDAAIGLVDTPSGAISSYGCDQANRAPPGRAVCFFHPSAPPASAQPARVALTSAVALQNLGSGQSRSGEVQFTVPPTAACGSPLALRYVGTVDRRAYSMNRSVPMFPATTLGNGGACQVAACAPVSSTQTPRGGQYAGEIRFGNGLAVNTVATPNGLVFGGQWFTGAKDRKPTWYTVQGTYVGNQADMPIYRFRQTSAQPFAAQGQVVGQGQVTGTENPEELLFTWNIEGVPGGELLHRFYGTNRPTPERTGAWVYGPLAAPEIGWGVAMDDSIVNGQVNKIIVNYIYDGAGNPVWTLGGSSQLDAGTSDQSTFQVHCPTCPNFSDFFNTRQAAGSVTYVHTGLKSGTYQTALTLPPPLSGTWNRTAQPWQMITDPVPQQ